MKPKICTRTVQYNMTILFELTRAHERIQIKNQTTYNKKQSTNRVSIFFLCSFVLKLKRNLIEAAWSITQHTHTYTIKYNHMHTLSCIYYYLITGNYTLGNTFHTRTTKWNIYVQQHTQTHNQSHHHHIISYPLLNIYTLYNYHIIIIIVIIVG